jgi:hypothetical protein
MNIKPRAVFGARFYVFWASSGGGRNGGFFTGEEAGLNEDGLWAEASAGLFCGRAGFLECFGEQNPALARRRAAEKKSCGAALFAAASGGSSAASFFSAGAQAPPPLRPRIPRRRHHGRSRPPAARRDAEHVGDGGKKAERM